MSERTVGSPQPDRAASTWSVRPLRAVRRVARDLPLAWKIAIPPLVMVLVFTPPAYAIIRALTSSAETELRQGLERRAVQAKAALLEDEFYLLESLRLAANIQGFPEAVQRGDAQAARTAHGSVVALKDRLDLLVATDARGIALAELTRHNGERSESTGTDWSGMPFVRDVLQGGAAQRASLEESGGSTLLMLSGPVLSGDRPVGAVVTGLDVREIVAKASDRAEASLTLFDADGRRVADRGDLAAPKTGAAGVIRRTNVGGTDVSVLDVPVEVAGTRVGSLALALPRQPAFSLARRVTRNLQLLLAVAILSGLVLLVLLTRLLLTQIAHLVRTNDALRGGNLSARAPVLGRDELGQLAVGLNAMAGELQTSYGELEQRVEERTRQLSAARNAAEEASKAKAAFLANMSHEIRTPMNAIIGMTSLLLDMPLEAQERDYVETVRSSGDHLLNIINDILDFSKIEAGHFMLEFHPFVVRSCVEEALDLVAFVASKQGTELAYVIEDDVPGAMVGDLGRLRQVLLNLLSNAVKFTEMGEVVVTVSSRPVRGKRHELHFAVRDNGIGIPADRIDGLFGAFTQVDASTSREYGGTGLGLAISQALVELMGGRIWVESTLGEGSTFRFTVTVEATDMPPERELLADTDLVGMRVLIVDDNATNRHVAAGHVARWGMDPTEAALPSEAIRLLRARTPFDLALLDQNMPEMEGVRLAARIKKMRALLPLVMLSSVGGLSRKASRDFAAVVTKPIKPSQLHDAVVAALAGSAAPSRPLRVAALDSGMAARHPLRILVAEDNPVNQKVAAAMLTKLGYQPDFASNGVEAVEAVARQPYDVVLMDVQMPEMDGLQASREICRRWARTPRPRIVAMTANATPEDRRECLKAGMDDYLAKPVTPPRLVEAIGRSSPVDYAGRDGQRVRSRPARRRRPER